MRRPTLNAVPYGLQALYGLSTLAQRKEDRPMDDGSKGTPRMTVGVDLGDRYSYLCFLDTESGEVIEEGRLRTTPEALKRRFFSERPLRVAIEAGTTRRGLADCSRSAATRCWWPIPARCGSSTPPSARLTSSMPRVWPAWPASTRSCCTHSTTGAKTPKLTWRSSARARP